MQGEKRLMNGVVVILHREQRPQVGSMLTR